VADFKQFLYFSVDQRKGLKTSKKKKSLFKDRKDGGEVGTGGLGISLGGI